MKTCFLLLIILFQIIPSFSQAPWIFKNEKLECISGDCKNGKGLAILTRTYCQRRSEDEGPKCYTSKDYYSILKGSFKNNKLDGFVSISGTQYNSSGVTNQYKTLKQQLKKLTINNWDTPIKQEDFPFTLSTITNSNFVAGKQTGNLTSNEPDFDISRWIKKYETNFRKDTIEVLIRKFYGPPILHDDIIINTSLARVDSVFITTNKGHLKVIFNYTTEPNGLDYPETVYSELKKNNKITKTVFNQETGWDLVIETQNNETHFYRELNFEFATEKITVGRSTLFDFDKENLNYGENIYNEWQSYKGGRNSKNEPHGFGTYTVVNTRYYTDKNDTNGVKKNYYHYTGYFINGEKNGLGREIWYSIYENLTTRFNNITKTLESEFIGSFVDGVRNGNGHLIEYHRYGNLHLDFKKIKYYYEGRFSEGGSYPYFGVKYDLRKTNNIPVPAYSESGKFGIEGKKIKVQRNLPPNIVEIKASKSIANKTVAVRYNKPVLVTKVTTQYVYFSDGTKVPSFDMILQDITADPNMFLCDCNSCNGQGTVKVGEYTKDVDSYYKQGTYGGTYKITEVTERRKYKDSQCGYCGGSGKINCQ